MICKRLRAVLGHVRSGRLSRGVACPRFRFRVFNVAAAGLARELFEPVLEQAIFCDDHDRKIFSGAVTVAKDKDFGGGRIKRRQRVISTLVPLNSYLRRLWDDSSLLPNVSRMLLVTLEKGEVLELDSEDVTSAFNLFRTPACWTGAFTFSRQVPGSVVPWGDSNRLVGVGIRTVGVGRRCGRHTAHRPPRRVQDSAVATQFRG